ncbi:MAG: hypothetical protein L0312_12510, partial [Acidobacteria bacterium]|nr:hypothetical protein [Acidobacteriota bacterium]
MHTLLVCAHVLLLGAPSEEEEALKILERVKASIAANRSAAGSVIMRGRCSVDATTFASSSYGPAGKPFRNDGTFVYLADNFGEKKRWEQSWNIPKMPVREQRLASAGSITLNASDAKVGKLGHAAQFDQALPRDFYRDHWAGQDIESLIKHHISSGKSAWKVTRKEGEILTLTCDTIDEGKPYRHVLEVNPNAGYLPIRKVEFGGRDWFTWEWKQEPRTGIWYP